MDIYGKKLILENEDLKVYMLVINIFLEHQTKIL